MPPAALDIETLLSAYAQGAFPMTDADGTTRWYTADPRGVVPLDDRFRIHRSLRQTLRRGVYEVRINHNFVETMRSCMVERTEGTWISEDLVDAYRRLNEFGFAHSVETFATDDGTLVGGLYGVTLGGAFFGESMFHRRSDASKVALVALVNRLRERDFVLLDAQAKTPHLARFGCVELPSHVYLEQLRAAIVLSRRFD